VSQTFTPGRRARIVAAAILVAATTAAIDAATLGDIDAVLAREEAGQEALLAGADFREGTRAFGERRPPRFTGE